MAIWTYEEERSTFDSLREYSHDYSYPLDFYSPNNCSFCASSLVVLAGGQLPESAFKGMNYDGRLLLTCPTCGWWSALYLKAAAPFETHDGGFAYFRHSSGVLKELDLTDLSIPTQELRNFLVAKYGDRFDVHPRKYEEIVGAVFSDFGFRVRVTSFSGDEGIDVFILDGNDDATVGIQVKRYRGKISAEQIRSFIGALVLKGLTTGIYVTTSSYERGASLTAIAAQQRLGVAVSLMDGKRFYDALKITQRTEYRDPADPSAPYFARWNDMEKATIIWGSSW